MELKHLRPRVWFLSWRARMHSDKPEHIENFLEAEEQPRRHDSISVHDSAYVELLERIVAEQAKALEFYSNWKSWDWADEKVYDGTPLTNIKADAAAMTYKENDGMEFINSFGGKRARETATAVQQMCEEFKGG